VFTVAETTPPLAHDPVDREAIRQYLADRFAAAKQRADNARTIRHRREAIGALNELLDIYLPIVGEQ